MDRTNFQFPRVELTVRVEDGIQFYLLGTLDCDGIPGADECRELAAKIASGNHRQFRRMTGLAGMLRYIEPGQVGVEIGCHFGDSSTWFARTNPKHLYLVDPYINETEGDTWTGPDVEQGKIEARMRTMLSRMGKYENWTHHRQKSDDFFAGFSEPIDWCFVDGNHNYDFAYRDCANAWDRLVSGGYLFVDDCYDDLWGKEVTQALYDVIGNKKHEIVHNGSDPVMVRKL